MPKGKSQKTKRRRGGFLARLRASSSRTGYKKKKRKTHSRTRKVMLTRLRNVAIIILLVTLAGGLIFVGVRSVLELKTGSNDEDEAGMITMQSSGDVVGVPGIPSYPESEFMYEEDIDTDTVQKFLAEGNSAYVLPTGTKWEDVVAFYENELEKLGWSHVLSVQIGDEERRIGEYWVFEVHSIDDTGKESDKIDEQKSFGLRFYQKINAIWYERLTLADARTGLASEVAQEKEIELLLAMGSMKDLPESYPWKLSYPELWDVDIREASLVEAPLAEFTSVEADGSVVIEPIAFDIGESLSKEGETFLEDVNNRRPEEDVFDVVQTLKQKVAGQAGLRYELSSAAGEGYMLLVVHPGNGIVYAVTSFGGEEAFFNYIVENLKLPGEE